MMWCSYSVWCRLVLLSSDGRIQAEATQSGERVVNGQQAGEVSGCFGFGRVGHATAPRPRK